MCNRKVHTKCNKYDKKDYEFFQKDVNKNMFMCLCCYNDCFPLHNLNDKQVQLTSQGIDIPEEVEIEHMNVDERQKDIIKRINETMANGEEEIDEMDPVNCKYYNIEQFKNAKFSEHKHHSILHLNIHSLELHIEELRTSLLLLDHQFDFICIKRILRQNIIPRLTDIKNLLALQPKLEKAAFSST